MNAPDSQALKLRISPRAESAVRGGHPWIFSDSVTKQNREGIAGEYAIVYDRNNSFLCIGLYDPNSPLRVRVLHSGKPQTLDDAWWSAHWNETVERRKSLFDDQTTGYRCCNGESDGWPGFIVDRYDATLVLKLYTAAWFPHLKRILSLLTPFSERVVLRLSRNIQDSAKSHSLADGQVIFGKPLEGPVRFLENGIAFQADVERGQKTGFFLDQRDNRKRVGALSAKRDILNVFSFAGGFSLAAAAGGARSATDLDISAHALEQAKRNFDLNRETAAIAQCQHACIQANAFDWLKSAESGKYDLIILDPPSLAKREAERAEAVRAYGFLVKQALQLLRKKGILVAASCSAHVSEEEFFSTVQESIRRGNRTFQVLETTGHPPDHPATFPEARYLKCIYIGMDSGR